MMNPSGVRAIKVGGTEAELPVIMYSE
jgi:hypothetical protein